MKAQNQIFVDKIQNEFHEKKALVIGDIMVDEYITGKVRRISPEAPVPVLDFQGKRLEAGGASNVAHNMAGLGAQVTLAGVAANDEAGMWLRKHFQSLGIDTEGIVAQDGIPTTVKTRYATKGQQLLRVDKEVIGGITEETQQKLLGYLDSCIENLDVIVLSDYQKGVLESAEFVQKITTLCNINRVPVTIDSKSRNIFAFKDVDLVKPNNLELEEVIGIRIENDESLDMAGKAYLKKSGAKALVVTRGSAGISVFLPGQSRQDYPAKDVQVYDVCGAGDTVLGTISLGLASDMELGEAVRLANLAAGVVISKVGTVAVTAQELLQAIYEER